MSIEVEIRSFISKEKYEELIKYFKKEGEFLGEGDQETFYFDTPEDLRIQKNNSYSKIWLKKGKLHDDQREEIEVHTGRDDFENLEKLFLALGNKVEIKWFRNRHTFAWHDVTVTLDYTKGYGYILELEKLTSESDKDSTLMDLKEKLKHLHIQETPKSEFDKAFAHYKKNWRQLTDTH